MLTKTPLHEAIAGKLSYRIPDHKELASKFVHLTQFLTFMQNNKEIQESTFGNLTGMFAETFLRDSLESICKELSVEKQVRFDAIPEGAKAGKFYFVRRKDGKFFAKENAYDVAEYDELMLIDGMPTIIEMKTGSSRSRNDGGREHNNLSEEKLRRIVQPVKEYFKTNKLAFMYVLPKEQFEAKGEMLNDFEKRNGILVPLYTDKKSLRKDVEAAISQARA